MALRALQGPTGGGTPVGGTGTTNTIPRWTGPSTLGDSVITQDANARAIGVGVTPNASWPAAYRAIQLGQTAAWMAASGGANDAWLMSNSYWDGASFRYLANGPAMAYAQGATGHRWLYFGSGIAGSAFSFTDGMILNTSGNVGIGTASPTDSGGWSAGRILDVRSGSVGTSAVIYVGDSGRTTNTQLGFYGLGYGFVGTVTNHAFRILQNNALRGEWTTTSLDISSTSGYGLKLPATPGNTDPNTLDCYADGGTANSGGVTWTPELRFGGATTGITYTTRVGRYTRVGNTVIAHCYVLLSSKGSATGNVTIAGLPTSSNTSGLFASVTIGYISGVSFTNQMTGYVGPNQTEVSLFETTNAGALSTITDADFTATSGIMFTVSYPVT